MSDASLASSLDDLERLLGTLGDDPAPDGVTAWHAAFKEALAGAERGPGWPALVLRAHALGQALDQRVGQMTALRGAIREELLAREKGKRALAGYAPRRG